MMDLKMRAALAIALLLAPLSAVAGEWVPCNQASDGVWIGRVMTETRQVQAGPLRQDYTRYSVDVRWFNPQIQVRMNLNLPRGQVSVVATRGSGITRSLLWEGNAQALPDAEVQARFRAECWVRE
jgi:hypothetical protein